MLSYLQVILFGGFLLVGHVSLATADVIKVKIAAHPSLRNIINNAEADRVLQKGSSLIKKANGNGDVACPVDLVRDGDVQYPISVPTEVDNGSYYTLRSTGAQIVFVPSIISCSNAGTGAIGCTWFGGVVSLEAAYRNDGVVISHEWGHYNLLPDVNAPGRIMHRVALAGNSYVTSQECNAYRGQAGGLMASTSEHGPPATAKHPDEDSVNLDELLGGPWPGGVKQFVPSIRKIPTDQIDKVRAAAGEQDPLRQIQAIWILSIVGSEDDLKYWSAIFTKKDISIENVTLKKAAFESLGVFIRRTGSSKAIEMLEQYAIESPPLQSSQGGGASDGKDGDVDGIAGEVLSSAASRARDASGVNDGLRSPGSPSGGTGGTDKDEDKVV